MSTDNLTTNSEPVEHSSAPAAAADPEMERLEAILEQCQQQQIARHSLALSYLCPQRDEITDSLRSLRRRRDRAVLEALLRPVRFFSIEVAAPAATTSINIPSAAESHTHTL